MTQPVDQLEQVLDATGRLVAGIHDEQWDAPTPCTDWNVRQLVDHLVGGTGFFAGLMRGAPMPPIEELRRRQAQDHLGDDPVAAYRAASDELLAAFREPGVLDRMVTVPIGTVPGIAALQLRVTEALVHGWDIARATGQPADFPDDVVARSLAFSRERRDRLPPGRAPFGPAQPVADDAPAIDQLAACLGRPVAR